MRIVSQACVNMMVLLTQTNDVVKLKSLSFQGDNQALKRFGTIKRNTRSRLTSIAMLVLLAHAFLVSVTHHHSSHPYATEATASITNDARGESGTTPGSAGDAHCLSCRLQRNFSTNVHPPSVIVQPLQEPLSRQTALCVSCATGSYYILSDRAPPAA